MNILGPCCCPTTGECTGISIRARNNWGGFAEIPAWTHGTYSIAAGDDDAAWADFANLIAAVFGPLTGSGFTKRFALWGDTYDSCSVRYLNKTCAWEAVHVFDAGEGPTNWSQQWTMTVEKTSGLLVSGTGSNTGSTSFWSYVTRAGVSLNGSQNIGTFWEYDVDQITGTTTENGSPLNGYSTTDDPWAIDYLGALAYLAAGGPSGWPGGSYINLVITATSATLEASTISPVDGTTTISTAASVLLEDAYTLISAMADAAAMLSDVPLSLGGSYTVWDGGVATTKTLGWMTEGQGTGTPYPNCVQSWTVKYEHWPAVQKTFADRAVDTITDCNKLTVKAERTLSQGSFQPTGEIRDVINLEKGRVPPSVDNCITHHEIVASTSTDESGYTTCTYAGGDITCEFPFNQGTVQPSDMLYEWGVSEVRQRCTAEIFKVTNCGELGLVCTVPTPSCYSPMTIGESNCCSCAPLQGGVEVETTGGSFIQEGVHWITPCPWNEALWPCAEPGSRCAETGYEDGFSNDCDGPVEQNWEELGATYNVAADSTIIINVSLADFNGDLATVSLSRFAGSQTGAETVLFSGQAITGCTPGTACVKSLSDFRSEADRTFAVPAGAQYFRITVTDSSGRSAVSWRKANGI